MSSASVYDRITQQMLRALEGPLPTWRRPWRDMVAKGVKGCTAMPVNAVSGRPYHGLNFAMLSATGYSDQRWLTFRQAKELGGYVRRGEHGQLVVFWRITESEDKETGEIKKSFLLRHYTVFNVAQCDSLKLPDRASDAPSIETTTATDSGMDAIYKALGAHVSHGGNEACYVPALDAIRLPYPEQFSSRDAYVATALHELGHWTGHPSRLNRDLSGRFGSKAYAAEELVAELTAAFMCAQLAVNMALEHHASYIESWRRLLTEDSRAVVTASSKAQAACKYMLERIGAPAANDDDAGEAAALVAEAA